MLAVQCRCKMVKCKTMQAAHYDPCMIGGGVCVWSNCNYTDNTNKLKSRLISGVSVVNMIQVHAMFVFYFDVIQL